MSRRSSSSGLIGRPRECSGARTPWLQFKKDLKLCLDLHQYAGPIRGEGTQLCLKPGHYFWISAPALSEVTAPRRYRDVCSIARSLRGTIGRMFDNPPRVPEGRLTVRCSRPTPCRQSSPLPGEGRDPALVRGAKVRRHATWRPRATTRERRQLRHFAQLGRLAVQAEWRRGVGRQARQGGGGIALICMCFLKYGILETVQVSCTFHFCLDAVEDCRTAPLFDRPEKHSSLQHVWRQSSFLKSAPQSRRFKRDCAERRGRCPVDH